MKTNIKKLLQEATPRPWSIEIACDGSGDVIVNGVERDEGGAPYEAYLGEFALLIDAQLVVALVNAAEAILVPAPSVTAPSVPVTATECTAGSCIHAPSFVPDDSAWKITIQTKNTATLGGGVREAVGPGIDIVEAASLAAETLEAGEVITRIQRSW